MRERPSPPRQFRRRTPRGTVGYYNPATDIVAVDPARADMDGWGGNDGYYATLLHELLHATGHARRLGRPTTGNYAPSAYALEEGTVAWAQRIVLSEIGFPEEAIEWHVPRGFPLDRRAAGRAAAWLLQ
jgi:antirestriction protein ArdC